MVSRSDREGSPRSRRARRPVLLAIAALGGLLPAVGCQVEYAGMTLPSGKYMHDDVQYFAPGPDFPWANTQAATQRARMQALGLDVSAVNPANAQMPTPAQGALAPSQNVPNMPTNVNTMERPVPAPPAPAADFAPGAPGADITPPPPAGLPGPGGF
jgi:hypothetical protein